MDIYNIAYPEIANQSSHVPNSFNFASGHTTIGSNCLLMSTSDLHMAEQAMPYHGLFMPFKTEEKLDEKSPILSSKCLFNPATFSSESRIFHRILGVIM